MDVLVSTAWLAAELGAPDLVVLDCTVWLRPGEDGFASISGRQDWAEGHIPGAGFADLEGALSDPSSPWRYAVPPAEDFAAAMAALGVDNSSRVVLYDDNQSMWAARVWWMLRWIGFDNAAVLDGGMKAWRAEGRPISTDAPAPAVGTLDVGVRPSLIADKAEVLAAIGDGATCLIDALPEALFTGEVTAYRRTGHIPGATNTSAAGLIDPETGRYLDRSQLAGRFPEDRNARVITYCGGGIAASSDALVLTMLGYDDVAVYTASLQEWTADPDAPLTTG